MINAENLENKEKYKEGTKYHLVHLPEIPTFFSMYLYLH